MKEDSKIFWKYVQSKTKTKEDIPCIKDDEGNIHLDNKEKAELLNNFFQSVFTIEDNSQEITDFPKKNRRDPVLCQVQCQ